MTTSTTDLAAELGAAVAVLRKQIDELSAECAALRDDVNHAYSDIATMRREIAALRHPSASEPIDVERAIAASRAERLI